MGLDKKARAEQRALKLTRKRYERRTSKEVFNRMLDKEMFDTILTRQSVQDLKRKRHLD